MQSDELNSFIAMWQEGVQSAASNLPALFKGLNSSWLWPQTASCLALGGSEILACFIVRDSWTNPGMMPLVKLLLSLEPYRSNRLKNSSQRRSVCPCFLFTQTHPTAGLPVHLLSTQTKQRGDWEEGQTQQVSLNRLSRCACYLPLKRLHASWLSWPKII